MESAKQVPMPEIDPVPGSTIMRQGENIAFPVPDRECHQRLVAGQQALDVVGGQGLRVGQRRVVLIDILILAIGCPCRV